MMYGLLDGGVSHWTLCFRCYPVAGLTFLRIQKTGWVVISLEDFVRPIDRGSAWVGFQVSCWRKLFTADEDVTCWGEIVDWAIV